MSGNKQRSPLVPKDAAPARTEGHATPTAVPDAGAVMRALDVPGALSPAAVTQLQRSVGNQVVIQRLPYAQAYGESSTKSILNASEGRASPVNGAAGHPRQHVGNWEKAERFAEQQGKTKSVYKNTGQQDKAISSALSSADGQAALALLDAAPAVAGRQTIAGVASDAAEVLVVKAKKKKGAGAAAGVKSWTLTAGMAEKATVVIDSLGTGAPGAIHLQTAYPVLD